MFSSLTELDTFLFLLNMFFGAAGVITGQSLLSNNLNEPSKNLKDILSVSHIKLLLGRVVVGVTYGVAISLFTAGELTSDIYSVLKVCGFTLATSAFLPKLRELRETQKNKVIELIDKRINEHQKMIGK